MTADLASFFAGSAGAFLGTSAAAAVAFYGCRTLVRHMVSNWTHKAHETNRCPICKQPVAHEHEVGS